MSPWAEDRPIAWSRQAILAPSRELTTLSVFGRFIAANEHRTQRCHHDERCKKYDVIPKRKLFPQAVMHRNEHDHQDHRKGGDRAAASTCDPRASHPPAKRRRSA